MTHFRAQPLETGRLILRILREVATDGVSEFLQAEINALDIQRAILPPLDNLLESIREAFENTPAELAEDILTHGIHLSGGGALLTGLREWMGNLLNVPVSMGENPQDEVALGACIAASDDRIYQKLSATGCLLEV